MMMALLMMMLVMAVAAVMMMVLFLLLMMMMKIVASIYYICQIIICLHRRISAHFLATAADMPNITNVESIVLPPGVKSVTIPEQKIFDGQVFPLILYPDWEGARDWSIWLKDNIDTI